MGGRAAVFAGGAHRANLYVYDPDGRIHWYAVTPGSFEGGRYFTLGRAPDCDIRLRDGSVSARHAYLAAREGDLVVHDLHSTNGLFVNDVRVAEATLRHGDVLRIGATDVRFLLSDRRSPAQLVLEFVGGPNAGRSIPTFGSSVSIGRLNCAVNLAGPGVAPQHVRVDVYGRDLVYVVDLRSGSETLLEDQRVRGVAPARSGDRLRVGAHEMILRVVEDSDLVDAIPAGDGTLPVGVGPGVRVRDPVAHMSSDQIRVLQARLSASDPPPPAGDDTLVDGGITGEVKLTPTAPPERRPAPSPVAHPPVPRSERPAAPPAARRRVRPVVVLGALVVAAGIAALVPVPRSLRLDGVLAPGAEQVITSPVRGRVERLYFEAGERVVAGDPVARLVDLDAQDEIERLTARIRAMEQALGSETRVVAGEVPPALARRLEDAQTALRNATQLEKLRTEEFHRRSVPFTEVERARRAVEAARDRVEALQRQVEVARARRRVVSAGPDATVVAELERLLAAREALEARVFVVVEAPRDGLLRVERTPRRPGDEIGRGEALFVVVDTAELRLRAPVPGRHLGAVESSGRAVVTPEGYPERRLEIPLDGTSPTAGADGSFTIEARVPNLTGALRAGQRVRVEIPLPDGTLLGWIGRRLTDL